jgi:hypothetical protein
MEEVAILYYLPMETKKIRGNTIHAIVTQDPLDPCWNLEDCARFATLQARFATQPAMTLDVLQCMVWKAKFPGLVYADSVENLIRAHASIL